MATDELYRSDKDKQLAAEEKMMREMMIREMKKKLQFKIDEKDPEVYKAFKLMIGSEEGKKD
jgi:hypothetical protein